MCEPRCSEIWGKCFSHCDRTIAEAAELFSHVPRVPAFGWAHSQMESFLQLGLRLSNKLFREPTSTARTGSLLCSLTKVLSPDNRAVANMSVNLAYCLLWAGKQTASDGSQTMKMAICISLLAYRKKEHRGQKTHEPHSHQIQGHSAPDHKVILMRRPWGGDSTIQECLWLVSGSPKRKWRSLGEHLNTGQQ